MAQIGDIVLLRNVRWVITALPNANAYLSRPEDGGSMGFLTGQSGLTVVESPSFQEGDAVTVNGLKGSYLGAEDGVARVLLEARSVQRPSGSFAIAESVARMNLGWLVLENKL
ncbi:hypothetical protein [Mesorhizobium sp. B2-4-17]|uniref:hypothetical protein n=1 Tax=Mesorhizobium sp. B2-4-17 TaxID=2589932 RepID=UPI00112AFD44|nr:hypothetical protein [Mesorhizobium sp. B2-4-17]TPK69900.1 hypothetical protein FJ548_29670 [Mesorhizobium sp. B2-4-17]